jgi:hypothetical protein
MKGKSGSRTVAPLCAAKKKGWLAQSATLRFGARRRIAELCSLCGSPPNLRCAPGPWYFSTMGANEVLEYVKALPPGERRKFFGGIHGLAMVRRERVFRHERGATHAPPRVNDYQFALGSKTRI